MGLGCHQVRQNGDVEREEHIFHPGPVIARADEQIMDQAKAGKARNAEAQHQGMFQIRPARNHQKGAQHQQRAPAAPDGDAQPACSASVKVCAR